MPESNEKSDTVEGIPDLIWEGDVEVIEIAGDTRRRILETVEKITLGSHTDYVYGCCRIYPFVEEKADEPIIVEG